MGTVEFRLSSTGDRLVAAGFSSIERAAAKAGRAGSQAGLDISRGLEKARHGAEWATKVMAGIGAAELLRRARDYGKALGDIQVNAGLSADEMNKLRDRIEDVAKSSTLSNAAVATMVAGLGTSREAIEYAKTGLADMAAIAKALNIEGSQVGAWAKDMRKIGVDPRNLKEAAGLLKQIGMAGGIAISQRMGEAGGFMKQGKGKYSGMGAVQQMGALYALTGGDEAQSQQVLKAISKNRMNPVLRGLTKVNQWGGIDEILAAVMRTAGSRPEQLSGFLGGRSKFSDELAASWDVKGKSWKAGSRIANVFGATGGGAAIDAALRARRTGPGAPAEKLQERYNAARNFLEGNTAKALEFAADNPGTAAGLGLGAYGAYKLAGRAFKGGGGGGAGIASGLGGAMPVTVTNWPPGLGGASTPGAVVGPGAGPTKSLGFGGGTGLLMAGALLPAVIDRARMSKEQLLARDLGESNPAVAALRAKGAALAAQGVGGDPAVRALMNEYSKQQGGAFGKYGPGGAANVGAALEPVLRELIAAIRKNPATVKVKPAPGLVLDLDRGPLK